MKNVKKRNKLKLSFANRSLKIVAGTLTVVWIALLLFPIYWMIVTSLSGSVNEYSQEFSFTVNVPERYTLLVDYSEEEAKALGEEKMYLEANSILWRMFNYKQANIGKTQVITSVDGKITTSYMLSKADFEINKSKMWTKNILNHKDIERLNDTIKESGWVVVETEKVEMPKVQNRNEFSEKMVVDFSEDKDIVGTVAGCSHCKSYGNLLDNYKIAWAYPNQIGIDGGMAKPIFNTLFVASTTIILTVTISAAAAYSLSKLLPRWLRGKMQLLIMATGMIPGTVTLIPKFQVIQNVGLADSLWALIIPACASFGAMLLFKATFDAYPNEVLEAARIDGAGELYLFFRLALPAAKGVVGIQILSIFAGTWNDYFWPSMVIRDEAKYTVSLVINYLMNISSASFNLLLALGFIISVPTLLIYALFQKYLTYGIDYSGIKG